MADVFDAAEAALEAAEERSAAFPIVYHRGPAAVEITARQGRKLFKIDEGQGFSTYWESVDFLVAAAALVFNEIPTQPQRGDRITRTHRGELWTYEVAAPGEESHYRLSDSRTLRIHTKLLNREPAPA